MRQKIKALRTWDKVAILGLTCWLTFTVVDGIHITSPQHQHSHPKCPTC